MHLSYLFTPPTTAPTSAVATMPAIDGFDGHSLAGLTAFSSIGPTENRKKCRIFAYTQSPKSYLLQRMAR